VGLLILVLAGLFAGLGVALIIGALVDGRDE
jgi:hypothetical protein